MTASPTERSLQYARKQGWRAQKVEWHNAWAGAVVPITVRARMRGTGGTYQALTCPTCGHQRRTGLKQDLFQFVDVLCVAPLKREGFGDCAPAKLRTLGIQATSQSNAAARVHKIQEECWEAAQDCLDAGWILEVWGWGQYVAKRKDGSKAKRKAWRVRRLRILSQTETTVVDSTAGATPAVQE